MYSFGPRWAVIFKTVYGILTALFIWDAIGHLAEPFTLNLSISMFWMLFFGWKATE